MPPMIVAPERDVPGISANACAQPIFSASDQRRSSMLSMRTVAGLRRCRRSAQRMTNAPTMNADATGTGANRCALIALLKARPRTAAGRNAMNRFSTKRCAERSLNIPPATAEQFGAVLPTYGENRAGLDDNLEQLCLVAGVAQQRSGDDQMAGTGNGKKFREALDDAENRRGQQIRKVHGSRHKKRPGSVGCPARAFYRVDN